MIFLRKTWKYAVRIGCSILMEFPYKYFYITPFHFFVFDVFCLPLEVCA